MRYECGILGINPLWISALLTAAFLFMCRSGGDNVNWGYLGLEVLFPFYTAVMIGEWCRTRTDPMFDMISAQGRSLFGWIVRRFVFLFGVCLLFAFFGMIGTAVLRSGNSVPDLLVTYLPTAFFLSSVGAFVSLLGSSPHIPAMAVGILWLFSVMSMSLLRFDPVQYFYLFARYAGISEPQWIVNKTVLFCLGIAFWLGIAFLCRKRAWR